MNGIKVIGIGETCQVVSRTTGVGLDIQLAAVLQNSLHNLCHFKLLGSAQIWAKRHLFGKTPQLKNFLMVSGFSN